MRPAEVKSLIARGLPDGSRVEVGSEDDLHFHAVVVSGAFAGEGHVQRHQRVYRCLDRQLQSGEIHAISLKTCTPEEWESEGRDLSP